VVFGLLVWLRLKAHAGRRWRRSVLEAALLLGAGTILWTELLGLGHLLRPTWISLSWVVAGVVSLIYLWWELRRPGPVRTRVVARARRFSWTRLRRSWTRAELLILGSVVIATGAIAWRAPPMNYDSMTYQFPRVMHWLQQGTPEHYLTSNVRQLAYGPGAAYWQTHLWAVFDGDRAANLVQWAALVGCVIALTVWLERFVDRRALGLAVAIAITLPMTLLQASSTQSDLLVGCWVLMALAFLTEPGPANFSRGIFSGLAIGLAVVTKPSAVLCLAPLAIVGLWQAFRTTRAATVVTTTLACLGISLALNLPHCLRNFFWFGNPVGTTHGTVVESVSPALATANGMRWFALNLPLMSVWQGISALLTHAGIDPNDPKNTFIYSLFLSDEPQYVYRTLLPDEDLACYTTSLLVVGLLALARFLPKRFPADPNRTARSRSLQVWTVAILVAFLLHITLLKWQWWGNRLLLPCALLGFPVLIALTEAWRRPWLRAVTCMVLFAQVTFVLVFSLNRPLVTLPAQWNFVRTKPLFSDSRTKLFYTGYNAAKYPLCERVVATIQESHARRVGLYVDGNFPEYVLWRALYDAGLRDVELYHLNGVPPSGSATVVPPPPVDFSVRLAASK
jgi:hypothetical protein